MSASFNLNRLVVASGPALIREDPPTRERRNIDGRKFFGGDVFSDVIPAPNTAIQIACIVDKRNQEMKTRLPYLLNRITKLRHNDKLVRSHNVEGLESQYEQSNNDDTNSYSSTSDVIHHLPPVGAGVTPCVLTG